MTDCHFYFIQESGYWAGKWTVGGCIYSSSGALNTAHKWSQFDWRFIYWLLFNWQSRNIIMSLSSVWVYHRWRGNAPTQENRCLNSKRYFFQTSLCFTYTLLSVCDSVICRNVTLCSPESKWGRKWKLQSSLMVRVCCAEWSICCLSWIGRRLVMELAIWLLGCRLTHILMCYCCAVQLPRCSVEGI